MASCLARIRKIMENRWIPCMSIARAALCSTDSQLSRTVGCPCESPGSTATWLSAQPLEMEGVLAHWTTELPTRKQAQRKALETSPGAFHETTQNDGSINRIWQDHSGPEMPCSTSHCSRCFRITSLQSFCDSVVGQTPPACKAPRLSSVPGRKVWTVQGEIGPIIQIRDLKPKTPFIHGDGQRTLRIWMHMVCSSLSSTAPGCFACWGQAAQAKASFDTSSPTSARPIYAELHVAKPSELRSKIPAELHEGITHNTKTHQWLQRDIL